MVSPTNNSEDVSLPSNRTLTQSATGWAKLGLITLRLVVEEGVRIREPHRAIVENAF